MGGRRPCLTPLVLILAILCLHFHQGSARNIKIMKRDTGTYAKAFAKRAVVKEREMAEAGFSAMDYDEPGANTNPRAGSLWGTPPPVPQR